MAFIKEIFISQLTDSHATDKEGVGRLRFEDDGKIYRYVKNADTSNGLAATYAVCHLAVNATTGTFAQNVSLPVTANLMFPAGVVASTTLTISTGATPYGWIQIAGPCTGIMGAGTLTAGNTLLLSNGTNYWTSDAAAGTAPTYPRGATLMIANTASAGFVTGTSTILLRGLL